EIIRATRPQPVLCKALDPLAHRIKRVALSFLESEDEVAAEEDGHLLAAMDGGIVNHGQGHEGVVVVEIHLRPLPGVYDVLQRQRVQAESRPDLFYQPYVGQAGAVQPDDRPMPEIPGQIFEAGVTDDP